MELKRLITPKIGGLCAVLGPVIGLTFVGVAIYYAPWFSWTDNYLSDLGGEVGDRPIWSAEGNASIFLNVGLIIAGAMGVVFSLIVRNIRILDTSLGRLGTSFLFLDMCALCAVGIFPKSTGFPHGLASVAFFFLIPFSLLLIGIETTKSPKKTLGWFITFLGIASLLSFPLFLLPRPWGGNAIIEIFASLLISTFTVIFGIGLLRDRFEMT